MAAQAKYLFDQDFAAGASAAEKPVAPSEHVILLAEAESKGFRDGFAAAEKEGTAVAARRSAVALKGATDTVRQFFLGNMSTRAAKMLVDDMQALGPVRLRDVDEAQALLVNLAKDLAAKGEIMITKNGADDELIY